MTPQIRNGNAQRLNARLLASSSQCAVASFVAGVSVQCYFVALLLCGILRASISVGHDRFMGEDAEPATARQVY